MTTTVHRLAEAAACCLSRVCVRLMTALVGVISMAGIGGASHGFFESVRTVVVTHGETLAGFLSTCLSAGSRAGSVPVGPVLSMPTTQGCPCDSAGPHRVDVTQENHSCPTNFGRVAVCDSSPLTSPTLSRVLRCARALRVLPLVLCPSLLPTLGWCGLRSGGATTTVRAVAVAPMSCRCLSGGF
jgi:hypothetical protein